MFKVLLSIIIVFTIYVLLVLNVPIFANSIAKLIGTEEFNIKILELKSSFNKNSTNIPNKNEFISGALDIKNTIIDSVDSTKEKIDSIRQTLSGAENTYKDIKEGYNDIQNFVNTNSGKIDDIKNVLNNVSEIRNTITNTGETN